MKKFLLLITIILYSIPSHGLWYKDHVKRGADIFMIDVLYPHWAESSYYACWNIDLYPNGGYFYGGIAASMPENETEETYCPNSVWTFWEHAAYEKRQARNVYVHPSVYASQYGGEGSSGAAHGESLDWVKPKRWYTMTLRTWGADSVKNESFVGWWMKDKTNNEWIHYGTFRVPYAATGISSNSGFLEDFGHGGRGQRELWRGAGFSRKEGRWFPSDTIAINVPKDNVRGDYWMINQKEGGKVLSMTHTNNSKYPRNLEPGKLHYLKIEQEQVPTLDKLIFESSARLVGDQLIVDWELDKHSSPQLGYCVEVFDNAKFLGEPIAVTKREIPQVRTSVISLPKDKNYYVRLTLHDIFDQNKSILISTITKGELIEAVDNVTNFGEGLLYNFYEKSADWKSLNELESIKPIRSGISTGFDITVRGERSDKFGIEFDGFLNVPETAAYTFVFKSCDGGQLSLGNKVVIDNDGLHSGTDRRVSIFLERGKIPMKVAYFKNKASKSSMLLHLEWESAKFALQPIANSDLFYEEVGETPVASVKILDKEGGKYLQTSLSRSKINSVVYYNGTKELGMVEKAPFELKILPFGGENLFWCRVTYDNNRTIDTEKLPLSATNTYAENWVYNNLGEKNLSHRMTYNDGQFNLSGEGEYHIYRTVRGDFELTGRVVDVIRDEQMGKHWIGLMAKQRLGPTNNSDFGIYHTSSSGLRSTANYDDLATTNISFFSMDNSHDWLKIVRRGMKFTTYSSADGKVWKAGLQREVKLDKDLYVGVTYLSTPKASHKVFSGSIADVELRLIDENEEFKVNQIQPQKESVDLDVLGYTMLDTTSTIVAVRYPKGLDLLLNNGDGEYKKKRVKLPRGVTAVRSIVKTGDNLLMAASGAKRSGIYLSEDISKRWELVKGDFPIAFCDYICGDILAVNPSDNNEIMAGSEKNGLYISKDGGRTWTLEGLDGVSISEGTYNPNFAKRRVILAYNNEDDKGEIWSSNESKKWKMETAVPNVKFTGVKYAGQLNVLYISSTKGLYTTYNNGAELNHLVTEVPANKSYFAAGATRAKYSYFVSDRHYIAPSDGSAMYRSDRYQCHWETMSDNLDFGSIYAIKARLSDNEYVAVYARKGIFESFDGGINWQQVFNLK